LNFTNQIYCPSRLFSKSLFNHSALNSHRLSAIGVFLRKFLPIRALAIFVLAVSVSPTQADDHIEEVIVTGDFRDVNQMTVAGSISVIDDSVIKALGATHLDQLLMSAANVGSSSGASHARFLQIRGVGDLEQFVDPKYFPSVGIVIDGVELGGLVNAGTLMDIKQVEVLRGPQGTRFGTSALAGMVNMQSNDATEQFYAAVNGGIGNYGFDRVGGVLNGALTESLFARLAVQTTESDGYMKNVYLGKDDTNNIDETSVRGKLHWQASDDSEYDLTIYHYDGDNGYDTFSLDNNRDTYSDQPGEDKQKTTAGTLKGLWQLESDLTLEAIFTRDHGESTYSYDEDWASASFHPGVYSGFDYYDRDRDSTALDIRLLSNESDLAVGENSWVLGVYGQERNEDLHRIYWGDFDSSYDTDREAIYGKFETALTDQLRFIVGARYEHFKGKYNDSNGTRDTHSDDLISAELTLEYMMDDNTMLYTTASQGQKPKGINTEAQSSFTLMSDVFQDFMQSKLSFDTETLRNYEVGLKGRYLADTLTIRAALFYMDRKNAQLESWMWDPDSFLWIGYLDSVDKAHNYGAELELNYQVSESLAFFVNVGYLETNVDSITAYDLYAENFVEHKDRDQSKSPNYQYSVGFVIEPIQNLSSRIEWAGQDDSYYGYYHDGKIDSYNLLNANISYQLSDLSIDVWGRNLTDEDYAVHALYFGNDPRKGYENEVYNQLGEPRVYGLTITYEFK
jgi:iron complex outermembrane receptor protein